MTYAATNNHVVIIRRLMLEGALVDLRNANGWTALMLACNKGHLECLEVLLEFHASVKWTDRDTGESALMLAARKGYLPIVKKLLEHGASINEVDILGDTAILKAAEGHHLQVVDLLLEAGACVDIENHVCLFFTHFFFDFVVLIIGLLVIFVGEEDSVRLSRNQTKTIAMYLFTSMGSMS